MSKIPLRSWGFSPRQNAAPNPWPVELRGLGCESRQTRDYRWNNQRHGGEGWVIQYTLGGQGSFSWAWNGDANSMSPGQTLVGPSQLFVTAPGMEYEYKWVRPEAWEFLWIMVDGCWAGDALARLARAGPVFTVDRQSRPLLRLLSLRESLDTPNMPDRQTLSQETYGLILALESYLLKIEPPTDPTVDQARIWLKLHWQDATGPALATHFGYHPKYFIPWFKARTGQTPQCFLQAERLRQAALRLEGTLTPVAVLAGELGFDDPRYFSRIFKAHSGLSPAAWRHKHAGERVYDEVIGD